MKKLFCLLLALMLLCGGALAENSGLRERRAPAEDAATRGRADHVQRPVRRS